MQQRRACRALGAALVALSLATVTAVSEAAAPAERATDVSGEGTPLEVILERAGAYVLRYGESFRNLVAEEAYRQVVYTYNSTLGWGTGVRSLRSDVVFVRLPGPIPWYTFRDVYAVDGRKVKDRMGRLERLFTNPSSSAREQAQAILAESTRYNLGEVQRNVNAPTVALLFLLPENQARLVFERRGSKTIAGFLTLEVTFQERTRPTLVQDRWQEDVPASGSFWIDPTRGTVLRTQIEYDITREERPGREERSANEVVLTRYRRESGLDIFVPDTMQEWYRSRAGNRLDGKARYLKYRRFQVTSDWEVAGAKTPEGRAGEPRP